MHRAPWAGLFVALAIVLAPAGFAPVAAQVSDSAFRSPTYAFSLSWDPSIWTVDPAGTLVADGAAATDQVVLRHDAAVLRVTAERQSGLDPAGCVADEAARFGAEADVLEIAPLTLTEGETLAGEEGGVAFGGFERLLAAGTDPALATALFVECRLLPDAGASLRFVLETGFATFADDLAAAGAVNESLQLDGNAATTPAATPVAEAEATLGPERAAFIDEVDEITSGPSTAGPIEGDLVQTVGAATLAAAGVDAADFFLRVRFQTPAEAGPWDFGVAFRQGAGEEYRLVLDSGGGWYLTQGIETDVQTGVLTRLVTRPGGVNSLELLARGETGWFRVNDEVIGPLDLTALPEAGPIALGTAFFAENTTDGARIPYRDLSLWQLGATSQAAATPVGATPTDPAPGTPPAAVSDDGSVTIIMAPVGDSEMSGTAVLTPAGDQTEVSLNFANPVPSSLVAIHAGTCAEIAPGAELVFAVVDEAGAAANVVPLSATDLAAGNRVIVVHPNYAQFGQLLTCGEITPAQ